jgi:hypothetical protein
MANRTATLKAMAPFALYTQPEQNFDAETQVWRDVSGANRHSDKVKRCVLVLDASNIFTSLGKTYLYLCSAHAHLFVPLQTCYTYTLPSLLHSHPPPLGAW